VEQPWTAGPSGEHTIIVRLEYDGSDAPLEAIQTVNVVKRPLHLHYWDSCPGLDYASAVMFSGSGQLMDEESFIDYWTNRGVLVLPWTGGICCTNSKTVDDMAQDWVGAYRTGFDGVTIDEFGSQAGQFLGDVIIRARELEPQSYFAVDAIAVGDAMAEDLRQAVDLVMVEVYPVSAVDGYARIEDRVQGAIDRGLGDKTVAALGIDGFGITTDLELRRQLHFTRYTFPNMNGIAFFGTMRELVPAHNKLLPQFYIGPVLRVTARPQGSGSRVEVLNIGTADASTTQVQVQREGDPSNKISIQVPPLAVGQTHVAYITQPNVVPVTEYREDTPILGPPLLWEEEPAELRPNAATPCLTPGPVISTVSESFSTMPPLQLETDTSGSVVAASYAFHPRKGIPRSWNSTCDWIAMGSMAASR